ncbi:hypothetical protein R6Q59_003120 [Mikania micrantha]
MTFHSQGKIGVLERVLVVQAITNTRNMASTVTKIAHLRIPLQDVEKATNNFHRDNIISRGDFGPAYKG